LAGYVGKNGTCAFAKFILVLSRSKTIDAEKNLAANDNTGSKLISGIYGGQSRQHPCILADQITYGIRIQMEEHQLALTAIAEWVFVTNRQFSPLDPRFHLIDAIGRKLGKRLEQMQESLRGGGRRGQVGFSNIDFVQLPRLQINRFNRDKRLSIELRTQRGHLMEQYIILPRLPHELPPPITGLSLNADEFSISQLNNSRIS
jgi:hypothetical protein